LLCLVAGLPIANYISITRYLVTLCQVWCLYHSYVGKVINVKILWLHNGPFGLLLGHVFCFFKGARPFFNGLMCCLRLSKMLGFDHFYINLLFPRRWSLYSFWCGDTCRDWYLSLPSSTTKYHCDVIIGLPITCLAFVAEDAFLALCFSLHYYYCDCFGFFFVCSHLLINACTFCTWISHPCLYTYKALLIPKDNVIRVYIQHQRTCDMLLLLL
jgi:hypothetical protein